MVPAPSAKNPSSASMKLVQSEEGIIDGAPYVRFRTALSVPICIKKSARPQKAYKLK